MPIFRQIRSIATLVTPLLGLDRRHGVRREVIGDAWARRLWRSSRRCTERRCRTLPDLIIDLRGCSLLVFSCLPASRSHEAAHYRSTLAPCRDRELPNCRFEVTFAKWPGREFQLQRRPPAPSGSRAHNSAASAGVGWYRGERRANTQCFAGVSRQILAAA